MATHASNVGEQVLPEVVPEKKMNDVNVEALGERVTDAQLDAAGKFLADMAAGPEGEYLVSAYTPEEEKAVRRKADWIIVPLLFWALSMGAVDKVALGTAGVLNIRQDLGLVGQQFSWSSSLIFFGQIISVFPALFLMQRFQTGKVIAVNVVIWGIISMCIAATHSFAGLAVCRFLLGFFESLTFPGFSLVISSWFTREEQVLRIALIFNTLSSLTNGLVSYGASFVDPTVIARWRVLFLIVGSLTLCIGILMLIYLPNSPMTAWWLTPRQRCIAVMRIQSNRTGVLNKQFKTYQLREALMDPKTWLIYFCNVGLNIPNGGTATFSSIIINGLGFSVRETMLLQIPTGLISWVGSIILSYIAFKVKRRNMVAFIGAIVPLVGTIILKTVPRTNQAGSMIGLYIVYTYWGPYVLMNAQMIANTGGNTKKTISYGVAYLGYLTGNLIGPQTFKANQAPAYTGGFTAMMVGYCTSILTIGLYWLYVKYLVKRKEKKLAAHPHLAEEDDLLTEWHDQTDFENDKFVYHK